MDDPFHKLQLSTLCHDLSDTPCVDGAGRRSAGVSRIHSLTEMTEKRGRNGGLNG